MEGVSLAATPETVSIHEIRSTRWIPEGGSGFSGEHVARLTTRPLYRIATNDGNIPKSPVYDDQIPAATGIAISW
ncbi:MAG: hypothetical protein CM1200mP26_00010 [Acidimicrobiales bacterium]|nr:MAG: hypothetical protein CM1200mP26_00010 [Acidimicrobiales bacterium]